MRARLRGSRYRGRSNCNAVFCPCSVQTGEVAGSIRTAPAYAGEVGAPSPIGRMNLDHFRAHGAAWLLELMRVRTGRMDCRNLLSAPNRPTRGQSDWEA